MAGFGHKHLADLGYALRPYLNPSAVEEEKSKSSSKYTKPSWQRELEQTAALRATEAKRRKGELSIRKSDIAGEELDKAERLRTLMESGRAAGTDAGTIEGARAAFHNARGSENPDIARVGIGTQHADMPLSQQDKEANEILYRDTMNEKPADILDKAFGGEMAAEHEADKLALAKGVMAAEVRAEKDAMAAETAALRQQHVIDRNAASLKKAEDAQILRDLKAKNYEEDRTLKALAKERTEQKKIEIAQRKFSQKQVDRIKKEKAAEVKAQAAADKKIAAAQAKADKIALAAKQKLAADVLKAQKAFDKKVDARIAKRNETNPTERTDLKVAVQKMMANQIFGEDGMSGSFRTGFNTLDRIDPNSPTTQRPPFSLKNALMSAIVPGASDALKPDIPIPESERDRLATASDEDWTSMLSMQERMVIMDQLWKQAVNIANSKGTSAQNEFNLLSLAISEGRVSPYEYMPGSPKTDMVEGVSPDIQVRSESDLLAALQSGDPLGNKVYKVDGVGAFQWDNATQKFVKIQ